MDDKETSRLRVNSIKVCVLRLKNSSRTIIFSKYTIDKKNFFKLTIPENCFKKPEIFTESFANVKLTKNNF